MWAIFIQTQRGGTLENSGEMWRGDNPSVWIDMGTKSKLLKQNIENQKFDSEERDHFGVTKKKAESLKLSE